MSAHVGDRLGAYLDAEMPSEERAEVGAHLRECARCARLLEEMAAVDDTARSLPVEAPEGYFEAFPSRLRRRLRPPAARRFTLPVWTLAAAAGLLLAVLTPLTLRQRTTPAGTEAPAREIASPAPQAERAPAAAPASAPGVQARLESDRLAAAPRTEPPPPRTKDATGRLPKALPARPAEPAQEGFAAGVAGAVREEEAVESPAPPAAELGYVAGPAAGSTRAAAAPPENKPAKGESAEARVQEQKASARERFRAGAVAGRATASSVTLEEGEDPYRALLRRTATTAEEARALREAWRAFAQSKAAGSLADEARVRVVQAGAQAFRLSGDPEDRAAVERDAGAYLARPDAIQAGRVRSILATLDPPEPRQPPR